MSKDTCGKCGKRVEPHETIHVADVGLRCYPCFNAEMAARLGLGFDNTPLQPILLAAADGVSHTFGIRSMLVATGREMIATETPPPERSGYEFRILGDVEADAWDLFKRLFEKMRRDMAVKHVETSEYGWRLTSGHRLAGRVDWDRDTAGATPLA